jgi:hypothetical protein
MNTMTTTNSNLATIRKFEQQDLSYGPCNVVASCKENISLERVKAWLGYQKGLSPFISNGPPHLKHVI